LGYLGQRSRQADKGAVLRWRSIIGIIVLVGVIISAAGTWRVGFDARRQIEAAAVADGESSQWTLAQAEVEVLRLQLAISDALNAQGGADLAEVRRRFDVLYSRMNVIDRGQVFSAVRAIPDIDAAIRDVFARLDMLIPLIDGPDDRLLTSLPRIDDEVTEVAASLRQLALGGVQAFALQSVERREGVATELWELAAFAAALVVLVLVVLVALLVQLIQTRRTQAEIAAAEDRLRAVVETAIDAVVVMDLTGRVLDYNGAAEKIFGFARAEIMGEPIGSLLPSTKSAQAEPTATRPRELMQSLLVGGGIVQLQGRRRSGHHFPVEVATATAQSTEGKVLVSFMRDISDRVRAQRDLVDARDRALAGEKAKSDLLAVMSHEMRTPINGIMGSLDVLGDTDLDDTQRRFVDAMQSSGGMLLRHVNTVLDISRIDADSFEISHSAFSPRRIVEDVVRSLEVQAAARGNTLSIHVLSPELGECLGDAARFERIIVNLVGNAIKFTEDGRISIEIERLPDGDSVEMRIADTGIGIAEEDQERVFSEFVTLDPSYARSVDGTGLGLAIVRRLVRIMGGEIGVESEPGEGSVFWFRLPLPAADGSEEHRAARRDIPTDVLGQDRPPLQVLLVEDNEINRLVAGEMLRGLGCVVTEVSDGVSALRSAACQRFDVILMDISMPRMNGLDATATIRAESAVNAGTPIIAMTAHAQPEDIAYFKAKGMADVIVKPVSKQLLASVLSRIASGLTSAKSAATPETDARADLDATLGQSEAARISHRAIAEIRSSIETLMKKEDLSDISGRLHHLIGLAAVVGLTEARTGLIAAQTAVKSADAAAARAHLSCVDQTLAEASEVYQA